MARIIAVLLLAASALVAFACTEEGDFLLEDNTPEATGTPPFQDRTPEATPVPTPEGSPLAPNATPVTPFQVETDESVNLRESPSTEGGQETVVGTLVPGETPTVVARVRGEAVEGSNDIWYQLEDGSFVYSGAVQEVGGGTSP